MAQINAQGHPNGRIFEAPSTHSQEGAYLIPQIRIPPDFLPNGRRSLCGVSTHAFGLGIIFGLCSMLTIQLAYHQHYLWRVPFFICALSIFHYLEFDMTARFNPPDAKVSSFLLFNNGRAYNIAHSTAILETLLRYYLTTHFGRTWAILPNITQNASSTSSSISLSVLIGTTLILLGQITRSTAMAQAGTSFNHIVQSSKRSDHILITTGVYSLSRHPAYCGFFWWGLGTQLVLGNYVCFAGYSVVLWRFFARRIVHEEKFLVGFFGQEYESYRKRTPVLIPLI